MREAVLGLDWVGLDAPAATAGDGFHSEREFADLDAVTPRLYLLTRPLMGVGSDPPRRGMPAK